MDGCWGLNLCPLTAREGRRRAYMDVFTACHRLRRQPPDRTTDLLRNCKAINAITQGRINRSPLRSASISIALLIAASATRWRALFSGCMNPAPGINFSQIGFDIGKGEGMGFADKADSFSGCAGASCTADAMHVVLCIFG